MNSATLINFYWLLDVATVCHCTKPQTTKINARGAFALFGTKPEKMAEMRALCSSPQHSVIIRSMQPIKCCPSCSISVILVGILDFFNKTVKHLIQKSTASIPTALFSTESYNMQVYVF